MSDYQKLINFLQTVEAVKSTLRHNWSKSGRQESVAEHTWRVVLFCITFNDIFKKNFDLLKMIKMLMIHDIPELKDGDVPGFIKEKSEEEYVKNEMHNAQEIFSKLPEDISTEYYNLYVEFEEGKTKEAIIARCFDRIESQLQHLESGPGYWSKEERGDHMLTYPDNFVNNSDDKDLKEIWKSIKDEIKKIEDKL